MPLYNPPTVTDTNTVTMTNKTLTAPTITAGAFSGANTGTMGASQAANTTLWTDTINNTQANSVVAQSIQIGTSAKSQGLLIQGTGSFAAANSALDKHLTLWGDTNGNSSKLLSWGNGAGTYAEKGYLLADGTALCNGMSVSATATLAYRATMAGTNAVTAVLCSGENLNNATIANDFSNTMTGATTAKADYYGRWDLSRTVSTAASVTDTYALASFLRTNISNNAGATLNAQGQVIKIKNVRTQTAGTCTDTVNVLELSQDSGSTGRILSCQVGTTEHHYVTAAGLPGWVAGDKQTTVGAAGAASALPAQPTGYLKVDVAGTTFVVPYYAAS